MDEIKYYCIYRYLEYLLAGKKITVKVANSILEEYEEICRPLYVHRFK